MASGIGIGGVDGPRLRRSLLAGADGVAAGRRELNRSHVVPIPDGDSGPNLGLTLGGVARALRPLGDGRALPNDATPPEPDRAGHRRAWRPRRVAGIYQIADGTNTSPERYD